MVNKNVVFYADSFNICNCDLGLKVRRSLKLTYNPDFDKYVFDKIFKLFSNDKNVVIDYYNVEDII